MNHYPKQAVLFEARKAKHVDIVAVDVVVGPQQVEPQFNEPINNMTPARSTEKFPGKVSIRDTQYINTE